MSIQGSKIYEDFDGKEQGVMSDQPSFHNRPMCTSDDLPIEVMPTVVQLQQQLAASETAQEGLQTAYKIARRDVDNEKAARVTTQQELREARDMVAAVTTARDKAEAENATNIQRRDTLAEAVMRHKAEAEKAKTRLRELEAEFQSHTIPLTLYRGACGHYWDSLEIGIEKCPICQELQEVRRQNVELAAALNNAEHALDAIEEGRGGCEEKLCADIAELQRVRRGDHHAILVSHDAALIERIAASIRDYPTAGMDIHIGEAVDVIVKPLVEALRGVAEDVCGFLCPSMKRENLDEWEHSDKCTQITKALAPYRTAVSATTPEAE